MHNMFTFCLSMGNTLLNSILKKSDNLFLKTKIIDNFKERFGSEFIYIGFYH